MKDNIFLILILLIIANKVYTINIDIQQSGGVIQVANLDESYDYYPVCDIYITQNMGDFMCQELFGHSYLLDQLYPGLSCSDTYQVQTYGYESFEFGISLGSRINEYPSYDCTYYGYSDFQSCIFELFVVEWRDQDNDCGINSCFNIECISNDINQNDNDDDDNNNDEGDINNEDDGNNNQEQEQEQESKEVELPESPQTNTIYEFDQIILYHGLNNNWYFLCEPSSYDSEEIGKAFCDKFNYYRYDSMTSVDCDYEKFPNIPQDRFKTVLNCYDEDYDSCSFYDCKDEVKKCLKLTCGEKPFIITQSGILLMVGGFVFLSIIYCFIYNYRHNKQIQERLVIMRQRREIQKKKQQEELEKLQQQQYQYQNMPMQPMPQMMQPMMQPMGQPMPQGNLTDEQIAQMNQNQNQVIY